MVTEWFPAALLEGKAAKPYGIIILNQPINQNALNAVLENAQLLICADAGGDRLMRYDEKNKNLMKRLPDAIVGDLDSLSVTAREHYASHGVKIVHDPDQYSTDFAKSLKWMRAEWDRRRGQNSDLDVVVMGGLGGRVDQGFSQIHHLYLVLEHAELLRGSIYLLSEQSLTFVLDSGENILHVNQIVFAENIGIIPLLGLTHISTSGMEWDVSDWPTQFGGQLSTSNHIRSNRLTISIRGPRPLFTLELVKGFCASRE